MHLLIVDQCSASKSVPESVEVIEAERNDRSPSAVLADDDYASIPARDFYTGKQQRRITDAVRTLQANGHDVERCFISAGFGVVGEAEKLPPYDATFSGRSDGSIRRRSDELGITSDLVDRIETGEPFDIIFLPLGADYYTAVDLNRVYAAISNETVVVVFNREEDQQRENVISIPARTEEAKTHGSTVVGLKGTYLKRFASQLEDNTGPLDPDTIDAFCRATDGRQSNLSDLE